MSANLADVPESDDAVLESKPHVSELLAHFGSQELIDARRLLAESPEYTDFRSEVIDLAYEEFCRRADAGESIDHQAFAHGFPDVEQSLMRLLDVHDYVADDPDSFLANLWPEVGNDLLGFSLVEEIGRGGFSRVFLAREAELGNRAVVVKICGQPNDEAARLGQLSHLNIVPVYSVQTQAETGLTAICMPYLGTATLDDVIKEAFKTGQPPDRGTVVLAAANLADATAVLENSKEVHWTLRSGSYAEALIEIAAQLSDALAYAHKKGIYHCDVKPSNVLVTANGQSKLFDFNLSLQRDGGAATVGGTLPYMAPEQVRYMINGLPDTTPQIDQRTDIFSLGVSVFQVLTGSLPFAVDDPGKARKPAAQKLLEQQRTAAYSLGALEQVVGRRSARTIASCLAFDPDDRPKSAETLARELRSYLSPMRRTLRWIRSHPWIVAASTAIVLAMFIAFGTYLVSLPPKGVRLYLEGMAFLEECRWPEAEERFSESLRTEPNAPEVLEALSWVKYRMGIEALEEGEFLQAEQYLSVAHELRVDFGEARLARGWARLLASQDFPLGSGERERRLEEARVDFEAADKQLDNAESAASRAYCYSVMGAETMSGELHGAASILFGKAIGKGFCSPAVLNNLGYNLVQQKQYRNAIKELQNAIDKGSDSRPTYYSLAMAEQRLAKEELGKIENILESLGEETETAAADECKQDRLECIERAQSHIDKASKDIKRAQEFGPTSAKMELDAARIYANAIRITFLAAESDQTEDRLADYDERLRTSWNNAVDQSQEPQKLDSELRLWLGVSADFPKEEEKWAEYSTALMKDLPLPNPGGEGAQPDVVALREERLIDLYQEILPSLRELAQPRLSSVH